MTQHPAFQLRGKVEDYRAYYIFIDSFIKCCLNIFWGPGNELGFESWSWIIFMSQLWLESESINPVFIAQKRQSHFQTNFFAQPFLGLLRYCWKVFQYIFFFLSKHWLHQTYISLYCSAQLVVSELDFKWPDLLKLGCFIYGSRTPCGVVKISSLE